MFDPVEAGGGVGGAEDEKLVYFIPAGPVAGYRTRVRRRCRSWRSDARVEEDG